MKKNKIDFETSFWAGFTTENPFKVINAFFTFANLDYYKQALTEAVMYCYKTKVCKPENPSDVFSLYSPVSSFLKVCFCLKEKSKKWEVRASLRTETVFHLSSLNKEEYDNPFLVFEKAFNEKTPKDFELFLREILEFSLSPFSEDLGFDLMTPYIHLIKMLDAAALLKERGVVKIRKTIQTNVAIE